MADRPDPPEEWVERIHATLDDLPQCKRVTAWTGTSWKVGAATVAHVFGGEDQQIRLVVRAEPDEVMALQHLGPPYFKASWGANVVGLVLDADTDWDEVAELLTDSYCVQAPAHLAEQVPRPGGRLDA